MKRTGLAQTLRTPGVLLGMVGMLCLGITVLSRDLLPNGGLDQLEALRWLRAHVLHPIVGRVLAVAGVALLFWGWIKLRPAVQPRLNHGLILALWSLPVLLAPPIMSTDAFLYADQGWIIGQGLDPYQVGLTDAGGPFAVSVHPAWHHTTAVYPPAALFVQYLVASGTGYQGLISVVAMRIPALLAVAVIALIVPRVARLLGVNAETAKWFAVTNPFLLIHFVGGMHNDIWMIALVLVAVWATLRYGIGGMVLGAVLVGLGAGFKQPGIAAAIAIGLLPVAERLRTMALGRRLLTMLAYCTTTMLIAVASYVGLSVAIGYEFLGWRKSTSIHAQVWGMSPASTFEQVVGPIVKRVLGIEVELLPAISTATTVLSVVFGAYFAWRYFFADRLGGIRIRPRSVLITDAGETPEQVRSWRDYPIRWMAWAFMALAFGGAGYHGWYLLWGGVYLGMLRYGNRVLRTLVAVLIACATVECGLEYLHLRPVTGYLLGATLAWIFWVNSSALQIVPEPEPNDWASEAEEAKTA